MSEEKWSLVAADAIHIRRFGEEAVLFDRRDGRTHYLSPIANAILTTLEDKEPTSAEIVQSLETTFDVQIEATDLTRISAMLTQLTELHFVSCSSRTSAPQR